MGQPQIQSPNNIINDPQFQGEILNHPTIQALSPKHLSFVIEFFVDNSPTKAAVRAGLNGVYGRQLVAKPYIKEAIELIKQDATKIAVKQTGISVKWVIDRLTETYRRAIKIGNIQAETKALELLGKHTGAFNQDNQVASDKQVQVVMNFNYQHNEIIDNKGK